MDAASGGRALWVAGYASYELGYVLEPKLSALLPGLQPDAARCNSGSMTGRRSPTRCNFRRRAALDGFSPGWDAARYAGGWFRKVHDYICAGDIYQANLTFGPMHHAGAAVRSAQALSIMRYPIGFSRCASAR